MDTSPPSQHSCDRCGAPFSDHDLRQGLAVRVAGEWVCPVCVDALPGDTQLKINQLRAMRGLDSTTYRVPDPQHPGHEYFTFSTSANILRHRRMLKELGNFQAPLLPARTRTVSHHDEALHAAALAEQITRRQRFLRYWPLPAAALLLILLSWFLLRPADQEDPLASERLQQEQQEEADRRLRQDIIAEPDLLQAWDRARERFLADDPLVIQLLERIQQRKQDDLRAAEVAIDGFAWDRAQEALDRTPLPRREPRLQSLGQQELALRQRLEQLQTPEEVEEEAQEEAEAPQLVDEQTPDSPEQEQASKDLTEIEGAEDREALESEEVAATAPAPVVVQDLSAWRSSAHFMLQRSPLAESWEVSRRNNQHSIRQALPSSGLRREITLPAGSWRLWLEARCLNDASWVRGSFGSARVAADSAGLGNPYRWLPLEGILELDEETRVDVHLTFSADDPEQPWFLRDLMIVDAAFTDPGQVDQLRPRPLPWIEIPLPDAAPTPPQAQSVSAASVATESWQQPIDMWDRRVLERSPTSLQTAIRDLPVEVGRYLSGSQADATALTQVLGAPRRSFRLGQVPHGLAWRLPRAVDLRQGRLSMWLSPARPNRTVLEVWAVDEQGQRAPSAMTLSLDPSQVWQQLHVAVPESWASLVDEDEEEHQGFDPRRLRQLVFIDPEVRNTTAFYLAALQVSPDPDAAFNLRPRALLRANIPNIATLRRRALDLDKLRVLCGAQFNDAWVTLLRAELAELLGIERMPNGSVARLHMYDPALNQEFVREYLGDVDHHIVVVLTGGIEFATGLSQRQALENFWVTMITEARRSNFLPVVVLGPSKLQPQRQEDANTLWDKLYELITSDRRFDDVPIIDLRPVQAEDYHRFAPGARQLSVDMLIDGIRELRGRMSSILQ